MPAGGRRSELLRLRGEDEGVLFRCALAQRVPAPTGRTGQRSAFPYRAGREGEWDQDLCGARRSRREAPSGFGAGRTTRTLGDRVPTGLAPRPALRAFAQRVSTRRPALPALHCL